MSQNKSFSLIRTNPLLTGNIKFVVKQNGDFLISSIPVNETLSSIAYTKALSVLSSPYEDIPKTFQGVPINVLYDIPRKNDGFVYERFEDMVDKTYLCGVSRCTSMLYDEEFSVFSPISLGSSFPKYLIIYKSQKGKETLRDCEIVNIINLEKSSIGDYFRRHIEHPLYKNDHIEVDFIQRHVTYTGISIAKSSIVQISESFDEFIGGSHSVYEFDKWISEGFSRHGLVSHRIFNIEFLFDDPSKKFGYENYFAVYASDIDLGVYNHSEIPDHVVRSISKKLQDIDLCFVKSEDSTEDLRHFDVKKHSRFVVSDVINIEHVDPSRDVLSYNEIILDKTRKPIINTSIKIIIEGKESETIYSNTLVNLEEGDYGYEQWSSKGWLFTYYNPFGSSHEVLDRIHASLQWVFDALRLYGIKMRIDYDNERIEIENRSKPHIELVIDSPDGTLSLAYDKFLNSRNNFTIKESDTSKVVGKYINNRGVFELVSSVRKRKGRNDFDLLTDEFHVTENRLHVYKEKTFTVSCVDFLDIHDFDYLQSTETRHNDILQELLQYNEMDMSYDPDLSKFPGYETHVVSEGRPLESIPTACKWVSIGKDVRGDEYRFNISPEFGQNNFTPSFHTTYPNPKFFTHEFFPISRFPLSQDHRKMSSYFPCEFDIRKFCFSSDDYFTEYFTTFGYETKNTENGLVEYHPDRPTKHWSIIRKNRHGKYTTMHRGVSITFESRDDIDGYRFANILNVNPGGSSYVKLIRNRKFKNIVLVCNISYKDYKIEQNNLSFLNLYTMGSQSTKTSEGTIIDGTAIDYSGVNTTLKIIVEDGGGSQRLQDYNLHYGIELDLRFVSYNATSIEIDAIVNGNQRKLKEWYSLTDNNVFMEIVGVETDIESGRKNVIMFRHLDCDDSGVYLHNKNLTIKDFDHSSLIIGTEQGINYNLPFSIKNGVYIVRHGKPAMESVEAMTPKSLFEYVRNIDTKKSTLKWYLVGGGKNFHNYQHEFVNFSLISEFIQENNISYTEQEIQDDIKIVFNRPILIPEMQISRYGGKYNPKTFPLSSTRNIPAISEIIGNYKMSYIDSKDTFDGTKNHMIRKSNTTLLLEMKHPEFTYNSSTEVKKMEIDLMKQIPVEYDKSQHFDDYHSLLGSLILNLPNEFEIKISDFSFDGSHKIGKANVIEEFLSLYMQDFISALLGVDFQGDQNVYIENFCKERLMQIYKLQSTHLFIDSTEVRDYDVEQDGENIFLKYRTEDESVKPDATLSISLI